MRQKLSDKLRQAAQIVAGPIPQRILGKTGISVSQLGLGGGCMISLEDKTDEAIDLIRTAVSLGINYIDTAVEYGPSEERVGQALEDVDRSKLVIATKTQDRTRDGSLRLLDASLKKLRTDYVDVWQIHHIDHQDEVKRALGKGGAIEALQEAKEDGRVRAIGVTGHYDPAPLLNAIKKVEFDTILMTLNAADVHKASFQAGLLPEAVKQGLGIIGMKIPALGRIFNPWGLNSMQDALDYVWSLPVATSIVGVDSIKQLEEDVMFAKLYKKRTPSQMKELEEKTKQYAHLANFFRKGNEDYNPWWKPYGYKKRKKKAVEEGETVGVNDFVKRQTKADFAGTQLTPAQMEAVRTKAEQMAKTGQLKPGYAPFVKIAEIHDPSIKTPIVKITPQNEQFLKTETTKRREFEDEYEHSFFPADKVPRAPSHHVNVILYSKEQLDKEADGKPTGAAWDIITVNAEPTAVDSPMAPVTIKRNMEKMDKGGSGWQHKEEELKQSEKFWKQYAMVK